VAVQLAVMLLAALPDKHWRSFAVRG